MSSVSSTSSNSYYYAMQKKLFENLDTDDNGVLNGNELLAGKPKTMSKDQVSKLYDALDTNKSGTLTMDEFAAGTKTTPTVSLMNQFSSDALDVLVQLQQQGGGMVSTGGSEGGDESASDAAFDALDTNKDGVVSEEEFLAAHPEQLTNDESKNLFDAVDSDKDGNVTQDQFQTITDATTPPRLMGPAFFGANAQTGNDSSSSGGFSSAYRLFSLLESEAEGTTTSAA